MVKPREDLTGKTFGRWTVLYQSEDHIQPNGSHSAMWHCKCSCKNQTERDVAQGHLKDGTSKSCGCILKENPSGKKHNLSKTRLYPIWLEIKQRCFNTKNSSHEIYGLRGITICDEWKDDFKAFYDWSIENGYDENALRNECTIDRIDTNGNYEPSNCRWTNNIIQGRNQRIRIDNTSGVKGVNWDSTNSKWVARISVNKKRICIGYFDTFDDAVKARYDAEEKYWGESVPYHNSYNQYMNNSNDNLEECDNV